MHGDSPYMRKHVYYVYISHPIWCYIYNVWDTKKNKKPQSYTIHIILYILQYERVLYRP